MELIKFLQIENIKIVTIEQKKIDNTDRPQVVNKYRKLLFFILREGILRTVAKILSKKNKTIALTHYQTLIIIENNKKQLFVNYSTQTTTLNEEFVIINNWHPIEKVISINEVGNAKLFLQYSKQEDIHSLEFKQNTLESSTYKSGVFIYGLGDYARVYIAQNLKAEKIFCIDYNYKLALHYKNKYNFKHFGIVPQDSYNTLQNTVSPLVIIATYHSDHTKIAREIFEINPKSRIFIEKPPCVTLEDIHSLVYLYDAGAKLEIGYNRRYISINKKIKKLIYHQQKVINISIKEILINDNHWYFWDNQGTRITGNLTHWIDLSVFWIDGHPKEITMLSSPGKDETIAVSILFSEGSLVNITVSDKGNSLRGVQEYIEIRTIDETFFIEDYVKIIRLNSKGNKKTIRNIKRKKGHDYMYKKLFKSYNNNTSCNYTKNDLIKTTLTTYYVSKMYQENIHYFNMTDVYLEFLKR